MALEYENNLRQILKFYIKGVILSKYIFCNR